MIQLQPNIPYLFPANNPLPPKAASQVRFAHNGDGHFSNISSSAKDGMLVGMAGLLGGMAMTLLTGFVGVKIMTPPTPTAQAAVLTEETHTSPVSYHQDAYQGEVAPPAQASSDSQPEHKDDGLDDVHDNVFLAAFEHAPIDAINHGIHHVGAIGGGYAMHRYINRQKSSKRHAEASSTEIAFSTTSATKPQKPGWATKLKQRLFKK